MQHALGGSASPAALTADAKTTATDRWQSSKARAISAVRCPLSAVGGLLTPSCCRCLLLASMPSRGTRRTTDQWLPIAYHGQHHVSADAVNWLLTAAKSSLMP